MVPSDGLGNLEGEDSFFLKIVAESLVEVSSRASRHLISTLPKTGPCDQIGRRLRPTLAPLEPGLGNV